MIALFEAYRTGCLSKNHWIPNLVAGAIVGVVALPLSMAFAIASGVKPEQGLYTAIVASVLVSLFGGTRVQIAGPTGAFIAILAAITAKYGIDGLQIATLMAGLLLVVMGLTRIGGVIKFIPDPVILGFTAGIAVVVWVGQWQYFFGLPDVGGEHFHQKLWHLLQVLPQWHFSTTVLALLALFLVSYTPYLPGIKRIPGPLVALVVITTLQAVFQFDGVATIGSAFGGIPQGLPTLHLPRVTPERIFELIQPAFAIAMLGAIESLLSAVVADGMMSARHDSNQELIGQGLGNIVAPLFGGFAATGAIARTATNIRHGGTSPLAGIAHAMTLILIIVLFAPYAINIPLAVLAAILFIVAWNMSEARHFVKMLKRAAYADKLILVVTFCLTIFVDLVVAVNIGVLMAVLQFVRQMATRLEVKRLTEETLCEEFKGKETINLPAEVLVYAIEGPFFFAAVERFQLTLASTHSDPRIIVFRWSWVPYVDLTGMRVFKEAMDDLCSRDIRVILTDVSPSLKTQLDKAGIMNVIGEENIRTDFRDVLPLLTAEKEIIQLVSPASVSSLKESGKEVDKVVDAV